MLMWIESCFHVLIATKIDVTPPRKDAKRPPAYLTGFPYIQ